MKFRTLIGLVLCVLLVSVVPLAAQETTECEDGFRLFEHAAGETCIPEDPQRIVTLTDQNALLPLLELGVRPVGSAGRLLDDGTTLLRRVDEYDTEGIVGVGDFLAPNLEAILELDPDLIVGYEIFNIEAYDELSQIAPTVLIQVFDRPLNEALMDFAEVVGATETAEELEAAYEDRVQTLLDELGERADDLTVSVITTGANAGEFYNAASGQALGTVMEDLGFNRPAREAAGGDDVGPWSVETLDEHDADVMLIIDFSGDLSDPIVEEFTTSPLFGTLAVAQAEQVYVIDGIQTVGAAWGKMNAFLDELEAILLDEDLDVDVVDEPEAETAADCDAGFNSVVDATGAAVCLPEDPQRIVALSEVDIDALLALDVQPIAVTNGRGQGTPPGFLMAYLPEDMISTGTFFQPNLEVILEAEPDLILFAGFTDPDVLEQLNAIAPVYNAATFAEPWQVHLTRLGEALGMEDEANAIIQDYETRVDGLREALGDDVAGEFVVIRWAAEGPQIMAPRTLSSRILLDLGLTPPAEIPELQDGHAHTPPLSLETLDLIDVDWAFVGTLQSVGDAADALDETLESPLFQALDIVQNNRVFVVDGSIWTSVGGYIGAMTILDDIEAAMLGAA